MMYKYTYNISIDTPDTDVQMASLMHKMCQKVPIPCKPKNNHQ